MQTVLLIVSILAGYLLGSLSASIILSKYVYHRDVRQAGSGNAGATNAARVFGLQAGVFTFLGDFLKTVIAMALGWLLAGEMAMYAAGAAALIGHCYPVYFKFKGGKAVSAGAGLALMVDWRLFLVVLACFALAALLSKTASVSSISAAAGAAIAALFLGLPTPGMTLVFFAAALIVFMHRGNIVRLIKGTEPKFKAGKK